MLKRQFIVLYHFVAFPNSEESWLWHIEVFEPIVIFGESEVVPKILGLELLFVVNKLTELLLLHEV